MTLCLQITSVSTLMLSTYVISSFQDRTKNEELSGLQKRIFDHGGDKLLHISHLDFYVLESCDEGYILIKVEATDYFINSQTKTVANFMLLLSTVL